MNKYSEMKKRHQATLNNFPIFYAFNNEQFGEGIKKLGLTMDDTKSLYKTGSGGFYKKEDSQKLRDMFKSFDTDMEEAIKADNTGEGFIFDMFDYEASNHEYCITHDISDTLNVLGITMEEIDKSKTLTKGFNMAIRNNYYED